MVDHKFYLLAAVLLIAGGVYYYYLYQPDAAVEKQAIRNDAVNVTKTKQAGQQKVPEKPKTVMVDVKGEVKHPGVYPANASERVNDVIQRAGGLTGKADENQVNLAAHVQDEMLIYIPAKTKDKEAGSLLPSAPSAGAQAAAPGVSTGSNGNGANTGKVNINKADETELQNLPGIGPAKAAAITQYRTENGPFQAVEDLKKVSGIGDKTFEKLKDSISTN